MSVVHILYCTNHISPSGQSVHRMLRVLLLLLLLLLCHVFTSSQSQICFSVRFRFVHCFICILLLCFFSASSVLLQCFFSASSVLLQCLFSASSVWGWKSDQTRGVWGRKSYQTRGVWGRKSYQTRGDKWSKNFRGGNSGNKNSEKVLKKFWNLFFFKTF